MGKGDRKTRRGKIFRSSYGNTRPHTAKTTVPGKQAVRKAAAPAKKTAARKPAA